MMKRRLTRQPGIFAVLLILVTLGAAAAQDRRIVAIGDVHGELTDFDTILRQTGIINDQHKWIGGGTILVQVGDVVDRGPKSRECLDLVMALERQARGQKGKVIAVLGNHEVMAMTGDLRYVSPEDYQGFATERSEKVREEAYQDYLEFLASRSNRSPDAAPVDQASREKWMVEHPLGFFERRDAFSPQGVYGRWLREHDAVVQLGDGLFVHGGLNPALSFGEVQELNQQVHAELAAFDSIWQSLSKKKIIWRYMRIEEALHQAESEWAVVQAGQKMAPELQNNLQKFLSFSMWLINSPDGPLWYRGLALEPEETLRSGLEAMLGRLKSRYLVAGHTPQPKGEINPRFGNRVFLIDTGMLKSVFGGRASALEIRSGRFTAYYADEKPQALPTPIASTSAPMGPNWDVGRPRP